MVGDFLNAEVGGVADHDAVVRGGFQVDRIDAGRAGHDGAQARGDGEVVGGERIEADRAGGGALQSGSACLRVDHVRNVNLTAGLLNDVDIGEEAVGVLQGHEDSGQVSHRSILSGRRLWEGGRWS